MSPLEALELALFKEKEALELYRRLSIEHPVVKDVFYFLVNEEEKHKQLLERKIVELRR